MKQLAIRDADVAAPALRVPEGTYKTLYLVVEGTNTGTAVDIADLGVITMLKNARPIVATVDISNMMHIANLKGGAVQFDSTLSDDLFFVVPILCGDPDDPEGNVLYVRETDNCVITPVWGANFKTRLDSGEVKICGDICDGVQKYHYLYAQHNFSLAAAGTIKERIAGEHFARAFIRGMDDADIQRIMITADHELLHDCTRIEGLYASLFRTRMEDIGATQQLAAGEITADVFAEFPIMANGQFSELLTDVLNLTILASGAVDIECVVTMADFTPEELSLTQGNQANKLSTKLQKQRTGHKGRALTVHKQMVKRAIQQTPITAA